MKHIQGPRKNCTTENILVSGEGIREGAISSENQQNIVTESNLNKKLIFSLLYQNVRGLNTKTKNFFLSALTQDHVGIALTETWLQDNVFDSELFTDSYQIFRQDRNLNISNKQTGGGILLALKNNIKAKLKWSLYVPEIECIGVEAQINFTTVLICLVYLPPPVTPDTIENFFQKLHEWNINTYKKNILIIGDLNLKELNEESTQKRGTFSRVSIFNNILSCFKLESCNRVPNNRGRTLDVVLVRHVNTENVKRKLSAEVVRGEPLVTEDKQHPTLEVQFSLTKNKNRNSSSTKVKRKSENSNTKLDNRSKFEGHKFLSKNYNFNTVDWETLPNKINEINWDTVLKAEEPNIAVELFYNKIYVCLDECVQKRKQIKLVNVCKKYPKWMSRETINLCKRKERERKKNPRAPSLKSKKKECKKNITKDFKIYIKDLQNKLKGNGKKEFWKFIKSHSKNLKPKEYLLDGATLSDDDIVCNHFANYFNSVYSEPSTYDVQTITEGYCNTELPMFSISQNDLSEHNKTQI
uniref:Endonuclease/exonuclease/phosphatase domain-containing protein n=1 Tax=Cacopsylla melanoneura TaxID=428564 RepID=A0A8D8SHM3_9HEMI